MLRYNWLVHTVISMFLTFALALHSSTFSVSVIMYIFSCFFGCSECTLKYQCIRMYKGMSMSVRLAPPQNTPLLQLCLSWGPFPPSSSSYPSLPPMCAPCPNPFPSRKALIEGAGFSLWPVGAHYCVFISKWGLPDWFNIHVSASYSWPYIHTHSLALSN